MKLPYENTTLRNLKGEEWRSIDGHEEEYEVSNLGRIKSLERLVPAKNGSKRIVPQKIRKQTIAQYPSKSRGKNAKLEVNLKKEGKATNRSVAALVLAAFTGPKPEGYTTHHKNFNSLDNRLLNLEYIPISDKMKLEYSTGLVRKREVVKNATKGVPRSDSGTLLKEGDDQAAGALSPDIFDFSKLMNAIVSKLAEDKITVVEVSKESGVNESTIRSFLNKKTKPLKNTIQKLCDFLGVEIEYFNKSSRDIFFEKIRRKGYSVAYFRRLHGIYTQGHIFKAEDFSHFEILLSKMPQLKCHMCSVDLYASNTQKLCKKCMVKVAQRESDRRRSNRPYNSKNPLVTKLRKDLKLNGYTLKRFFEEQDLGIYNKLYRMTDEEILSLIEIAKSLK